MKQHKQHIWIIGASTGIGRALAHELAQEGHHLALSARSKPALEQLKKELKPAHHIIAPLDVSKRASIAQAQQHILSHSSHSSHWHKIERVIFLAGIYQPMRMGELDLNETKKILETNLLGAFYLCESILPHLLAQHKQRQQEGEPPCQLAFCASVAGYRGLPRSQPYGASKAGLINMVESLRAEHGECVDIRLINTGFVQTRLTDKNDFAMPMRLTPQAAARAIIKGLNKNAFEIAPPKLFTFALKCLARLPYWLYFKMMR